MRSEPRCPGSALAAPELTKERAGTATLYDSQASHRDPALGGSLVRDRGVMTAIPVCMEDK
jgi:hypothetical protein